MRQRLAAAYYELLDRRLGYTWTRKREAIREAKKNGASGVYRVTYPRVGRALTGTARELVWGIGTKGQDCITKIEQDAHLIAAAPEMYAVLARVHDALRRLPELPPTISLLDMEQLAKALAKAEGKG